MTTDNTEINVSVTFRHTESTPALKSYASDKITHCLEKYLAGNAEVSVILSVEKRDHTAEVNIHSRSYDITARATTEDLYSAIDKVVDNVDAQIRKQKEKQNERKSPARKQVSAEF